MVRGDRPGHSNDAAIHEPCPNQSIDCMKGWTNWNTTWPRREWPRRNRGVHPERGERPRHPPRHRVGGGLGGSANRNLGDLFQVAFDRSTASTSRSPTITR